MGGTASQWTDASVQGSSGCRPQAPAGARSSLQRLSRELGNRNFRRLVGRAPRRRGLRDGEWIGEVDTRAGEDSLARAVAARRRGGVFEGKGRSPKDELEEELEGHSRLGRPRRLQRVTITQITPDSELRSGTCGERNVQWIFSLDKPAPEDGYIVQHIEGKQDIVACPGKRTGTMRQTLNFWEAWPVKKGDLVDWTTTRDGWTDGSKRPPMPNKVGLQTSDGEVKFFGKSKTGDLGDFDVAPADASSAWGPGKVPTSGALPSTPTQPSWWEDASPEKTAVRQALSEWDCCGADATSTRPACTPIRRDRAARSRTGSARLTGRGLRRAGSVAVRRRPVAGAVGALHRHRTRGPARRCG